ncbi:Protein CBG26779 [Caenorhabditis briggsae]|uniref:Uncharacterized protein n=2 Tax=Caenorhabditis briggsae TaxID=6238 RepID=A0AAE9JTD9_CAEBR|nr:Protein CBG26779 [Caenorhabditis briggsae]ULT85252.1 hypothetical protein L3Y34_013792 [Caenorhabditis briggsae]UMM44472.1 hypothetical protein L5515_019617 [Caenorhabditis briggsae]CAR99271.1 Protein CBG26779 [Caenorhabditis briggsae]
MAQFLVFVCIMAFAAFVASDQSIYDQEEGTNNFRFVGFGGPERVPPFESLEGVLRRLHLRALPMMKRSIAIGRSGFRPGKRSMEIFAF